MYKWIIDPGHAWLQVPLAEIEGLKISHYSFHDGQFAYLEEDCDAGIFLTANNIIARNIPEVVIDKFDRNMPRIRSK
jgi:hypothetical protein